MVEFSRGPLVWIAFAVFILGSIFRISQMLILARKDRVVYPYMSFKYGMRSLAHWLTPFASVNMRARPVMTVVTFAFHICLLVTPVFLLAHNMLLRESWGFSLWTLPEAAADVMTVIVIIGGFYFLSRRISSPEVAYVTYPSDFALLVVAIGPFVTGIMATQRWFHYETMLVLHIWSGAIMLMAIPFTRLSHMLYFVFTRTYMGSEFGEIRQSKDW